jgi:hypothetical protein
VADVIAEGIEAAVPTRVRERAPQVAGCGTATERGYLVTLETRRGRPARIVLGDPMPAMVKLLPEPGDLDA